MKKLLIIVGTRPNFIKVTQFKRVAENYPNLEVVIAHTGQHFDQNMSGVFFEQFQLKPDVFMNVKAGSVNEQIGEMIKAIDATAEKIKPDMMMAVGDVNSTLCASLVANKRNILLCHLESGLRSRDREMPEEINRLLTDEITDHFFTTEPSGNENLIAEGKSEKQIHYVGNTMIDTLVAFQSQIEQSDILEKLGVEAKKYLLFTMHRPSNVDNKEALLKLTRLMQSICPHVSVVFPIHPRTINKLKEFGLWEEFDSIANLIRLEPLDYFAFQKLIAHAQMVVTDSGGIQEETTFKQVPCLTIRDNTERPITLTEGTNELIAFDVDLIVNKVLHEKAKSGRVPHLWDGKATERIVEIINGILN